MEKTSGPIMGRMQPQIDKHDLCNKLQSFVFLIEAIDKTYLQTQSGELTSAREAVQQIIKIAGYARADLDAILQAVRCIHEV